MNATASATDIVLVVINLVGLVAAVALMRITWDRRVALGQERYPATPKGPRLRTANRQLRDRGARALFGFVSIVLAVLNVFDIVLPHEVYTYIWIGIALVITGVSAIDLYGELERQ